ncbi:hypothetical protein NA78x_001520 [Anatilimnocola sp. NA78]|uniref:hypothetical protein n=1 Tax=Anatilimnocola sp. NA78 TaxID=3415683 RepID=UPI003CE4CC10
MLRSLVRPGLALAVVLAGFAGSISATQAGDGVHHPYYGHDYAGAGGCRTCSGGDCQYRWYGQPDLFYNYYAPANCGGVGAELYLSPRPVPAHVGHTYITYQPLMPHEFLYHHHRTYHRYYNGGQGLTRTHVKYGVSHVPNFLK